MSSSIVPENEGSEQAPKVDRPLNPKHRVTCGPGALCLGAAVSYVVFSIVLGVVLGIGPSGLAIALLYSLIPAALTAYAVGLPTGLLMRRVRRQWLHVLAFFVAGAIAGIAWSRFQLGGFTALLALAVGLASAVGRLSVWKLVTVHDAPADNRPNPPTLAHLSDE